MWRGPGWGWRRLRGGGGCLLRLGGGGRGGGRRGVVARGVGPAVAVSLLFVVVRWCQRHSRCGRVITMSAFIHIAQLRWFIYGLVCCWRRRCSACSGDRARAALLCLSSRAALPDPVHIFVYRLRIIQLLYRLPGARWILSCFSCRGLHFIWLLQAAECCCIRLLCDTTLSTYGTYFMHIPVP